MKVLDVGAQGIIIPNVHSVAQVDEIVSYAKYQPIGNRGFAASRKDGWRQSRAGRCCGKDGVFQ